MNNYENDSFESSSSATSMSNESLSRNETEMHKEAEKENYKQKEENKAAIEEEKNTFDSNENKDKELVHHTEENSPATSESDSLNEEHKWAAVEADGRPEFKQLSAFVAFGSMSATSPLHSQRTSEYEQSEKREEELEEQEFEENEHEEQLRRSEETGHKNDKIGDEKTQNLLTNNNSLESSAIEVRKELASQPRSDVEFSFLSTLEEHLETLGNRYNSAANTNLPIAHKEESIRVNGNGEIGDDNMSKTEESVHKEEELEQSDAKPMEKEAELEQEKENLQLEHKLIKEEQELEKEKEEEQEEKNYNAIKAKTRLQRENLSISPTANEHRHVNLSKSVSFRLPSLPLPENLHTLEDSANMNYRNDDVEEDNYDNDIKEKACKQVLEQEQVRPLSLQQSIENTQERPEYLREQILNRQPYAAGHYNSHQDVLKQNKPFESTPSPLPSAKFNFNYANKHRGGNTQETPLPNTTDNYINKSQRSSSHSRRRHHENQNHTSKKFDANVVSKDDERLLSKAKTIQETSLAVERLVQSLATLRGYNKLRPIATHARQQNANAAPVASRENKYDNKINVTADSAHGVCNYNKTNATGKIDSIVEYTVLELVLRMLQQEKRTEKTVRANESLHYAKRRECHELITAENFYDKPQYRWYNVSDNAALTNANNHDNSNNTAESVQFSPIEQRHEPCPLSNNNRGVNLNSIESDYSKRFLHDHEALYKTIIDSVTKYVFKRVSVFAHNSQSSRGNSNTREKKSSSAHDNSAINSSYVSLPTISPSFCTLLLIDLVLLCKEIADTRLSTLQLLSSPLTNAYEPVLIKYCGQPYSGEALVLGKPNIHVNMENNHNNNNHNENKENKAQRASKFSLERELVTTLIHCLPFEIVQSTLQVQSEEEPWEQERLNMRCEFALLRDRHLRESVHGKNNHLIFRLEYWVGFKQMEVVINALLTCVRNLLSNCIEQNQYRTLDICADAIFDLRSNSYDRCGNSSSPECLIEPPIQHHPYFVLMTSKSKTSSSTFAREQTDPARYDRIKNEMQMTENIYRFPSYNNPPPSTTNMCRSTDSDNNNNRNKAQSIDINTFGLESIALQKLVLTVSKITTEMMSTTSARREYEQKREQHSRESYEESAKRTNMLTHGMSAEEQYTLFSSCVMEVVTEHLKDVNTIATLSEQVNKKYAKRLHNIAEEKYSKDNHSKVADRLRKREKALIEKSEIEAANVLEQIRQEVNVFNASHK